LARPFLFSPVFAPEKNKKQYAKISLSVCNRVMEDKLLIWKFKRGSREALRRIYDKHHGHGGFMTSIMGICSSWP
jgi:hypothetical protein